MVQAPVSGNEAHVAAWGLAGRPGGQRRSDMTAAAAVGGLALWRCHPARAQVSTVERCACISASGRRRSILGVHLSSPLRLSVRAYSERKRRAGGVGEVPNLPSRLADGSE